MRQELHGARAVVHRPCASHAGAVHTLALTQNTPRAKGETRAHTRAACSQKMDCERFSWLSSAHRTASP